MRHEFINTKWKIYSAIIAAFVTLYAQSGRAFALELRIRNDFDKNIFWLVKNGRLCLRGTLRRVNDLG